MWMICKGWVCNTSKLVVIWVLNLFNFHPAPALPKRQGVVEALGDRVGRLRRGWYGKSGIVNKVTKKSFEKMTTYDYDVEGEREVKGPHFLKLSAPTPSVCHTKKFHEFLSWMAVENHEFVPLPPSPLPPCPPSPYPCPHCPLGVT